MSTKSWEFQFALAACVLSTPKVGAEEQSLSLSVALPADQTSGRLVWRGAASHLHVIVSNASAQAQRIWQDWNSWGYYALSFELNDDAGHKWVVQRHPNAIFTRNLPSWWVVEPHGFIVVNVYFGDKKLWEAFPYPEHGSRTVSMRAVLDISPTPESAKYGAWTGRIISNPQTVVLESELDCPCN